MPHLPSHFIERTRLLMGEAGCNALCQALQTDGPVSIRTNRGKNAPAPPHAHRVPWTERGFYLDLRPAFTFDPLFHAGFYYVQEAASMFIAQALQRYVDRPVVMLDLCAAPGGKSTLVRDALPQGSLLVANEVMRNRSQVLAENLTKWGNPYVVVTNNDPAHFAPLGPVFDVLLTDVPCSGEGMFRKDEKAVDDWSEEAVELCWKRQRRIVADIWPCLKPGGLLIYSTCTFNREENEDNVAWIASNLGAEVLPVDTEGDWGITGNLTGAAFPVYRFLPHRTQGEGLFVAVLRKHPSPQHDAFPLAEEVAKAIRKAQADAANAVPSDAAADAVSSAAASAADNAAASDASANLRKRAMAEKASASDAAFGFIANFPSDAANVMAEEVYAPSKGRKADKFRKAGKAKSAQKGKSAGTSFPKETEAWIRGAEDFSFRMEGTLAKAIPAAYSDLYDELRASLHILHAGITLAEQKGKDWMPAHALAMSTELREEAFPKADLSLAQALSYLRREAIVLDADVPKGYVLLTFRNVPLGFAKNLGNRANNLYPQEWRIRSSYTPEELNPVYGETEG